MNTPLTRAQRSALLSLPPEGNPLLVDPTTAMLLRSMVKDGLVFIETLPQTHTISNQMSAYQGGSALPEPRIYAALTWDGAFLQRRLRDSDGPEPDPAP
jgi:hypothetical protein